MQGLADLIDADTEAQRQHALRIASGELRAALERWRQSILSCTAELEAVIDFGETEGDVADARTTARVGDELEQVRAGESAMRSPARSPAR